MNSDRLENHALFNKKNLIWIKIFVFICQFIFAQAGGCENLAEYTFSNLPLNTKIIQSNIDSSNQPVFKFPSKYNIYFIRA